MRSAQTFIDESANEDASIIFFGAVTVPSKNIYFVRRDLNKIRRKISNIMEREDYPIFGEFSPSWIKGSGIKSEWSNIKNGNYIEIHGAHIWGRSGAFTPPNRNNSDVYSKHLSWIEEILKLIPKYGITFRSVHSSTIKRTTALMRDIPNANMYTKYSHLLHKSVTKVKAESMQSDPFILLFIEMLATLDVDSDKTSTKLDIIVDKGKRNEVFRKFYIYEKLRQNGLLTRLSDPDFLHSHDEPILQLADVATILARYYYGTPENHPYKQDAKRLFKRYLTPALLPWLVLGTPRGNHLLGALGHVLRCEVLFLHSGGIQSTLEDRRHQLDVAVESYLSRYPEGVQFLVPIDGL